MEHETESKVIDKTLDVVEYFAVGIEVLAVTIIVVGIVSATYVFLTRYRAPRAATTEYNRYRARLGWTLLLGLEVLVAADVVRTVAVNPSLEVEIDHRWPWQRPEHAGTGADRAYELIVGAPCRRTPSEDAVTGGREMATHQSGHRNRNGVATYAIRVQGSPRAGWSDRLAGMQIRPDEDDAGCTVLEATLPDQAALIGVLKEIYDLGLPLLQVDLVGGDDEVGSID
ncbi:MAG TPA: DUF1622 domain-containing protein [Thermomicrobiales bacterium]